MLMREGDNDNFFRRANLAFNHAANLEGRVGDTLNWLQKQPLYLKVPIVTFIIIVFCFAVFQVCLPDLHYLH